MAKVAVTLTGPVTLVSVLGLEVLPSLHWTKWYPPLATAVTGVPLPPWLTLWEAVPVSVPLAPAV